MNQKFQCCFNCQPIITVIINGTSVYSNHNQMGAEKQPTPLRSSLAVKFDERAMLRHLPTVGGSPIDEIQLTYK